VQKALENTRGLEGAYATYSWTPQDRNGFPDNDITVNIANTLKDGSFKPAPR
jgi:branched-chain amino acid transport system substrate-binding protein